MAISTVQIGDGNNLIVTFDDGKILYVPDNEDNRFHEAIQAWLDLGNSIQAADPPPPPPTNQELADDLTFQSSVFKAFAQVILDEINILRAAVDPPKAARTIQQLKDAIAIKMP